MDKEKLAYAISALWALVAIPLSEVVYEDVLDSGLFMRVFSFLLVLAPVWIVLGWRWLTSKKPMPAKLWLGVSVVATIGAFILGADRYLDELAIILVFSLVAFLVLVWNYERGQMMWWRKSSIKELLPSSQELIEGSHELLKFTEELSNDLLKELQRLAPGLKLPIPVHATESLLCVYALVYLHFRKRQFEDNLKVVALFSGYKSLAITNFISINLPKIPGIKPFPSEMLNKPEIREPVKSLFKKKEEDAETVIDNLSRNAAWPFYPIYDSFGIFLSPNSTISEINNEFDPLFSKLNGKVKRRVNYLFR